MRISVVITTYNRPDALSLVLRGLGAQTAGEFEVLVADDGSTPATAEMLDRLKPELKFPSAMSGRPTTAFAPPWPATAPAPRRPATTSSSSTAIACRSPISSPSIGKLAAPGWLVSGNRVLLDQRLTERATAEQLPLWRWGAGDWLRARLTGRVNRLTPLLRLVDWSEARDELTGAKTCNLAVWREDFLAVNGFDEEFIGWGYEDSDLVQRLLNAGGAGATAAGRCRCCISGMGPRTAPREGQFRAAAPRRSAPGGAAARGIDQYLAFPNGMRATPTPRRILVVAPAWVGDMVMAREPVPVAAPPASRCRHRCAGAALDLAAAALHAGDPRRHRAAAGPWRARPCQAPPHRPRTAGGGL